MELIMMLALTILSIAPKLPFNIASEVISKCNRNS